MHRSLSLHAVVEEFCEVVDGDEFVGYGTLLGDDFFAFFAQANGSEAFFLRAFKDGYRRVRA